MEHPNNAATSRGSELGVRWYRTDGGPGDDFSQHDALVATVWPFRRLGLMAALPFASPLLRSTDWDAFKLVEDTEIRRIQCQHRL
jgi:hypothetical protein